MQMCGRQRVHLFSAHQSTIITFTYLSSSQLVQMSAELLFPPAVSCSSGFEYMRCLRIFKDSGCQLK